MKNIIKKSWKRFTVAAVLVLVLTGGIIYNFILAGLGYSVKSELLNEVLKIIINPLCLVVGAWIGADTMGKTEMLKNIFTKKK